MTIFPRISGRLGQTIDLNVTFYQDGVPSDPYAITKVSIYRTAVKHENKIAEFPVVPPWDPQYPSPVSRELMAGSSFVFNPGVYHLFWEVPKGDIPVPNTFFDVWHFIPTHESGSSAAGAGGTEDYSYLNEEGLWQSCCNQFWLYDDAFSCDSGLENIRLGFEALDQKFNQPEVRTLEVGIMPLPLYDYNYNLVAPLIPQLKAKIYIFSDNCEMIVDGAPMTIGLRSGSYRTNPFTLQYLIDTSKFLKGSYKYRVVVTLPNGQTRASSDFSLQVG
jgi:hypothetical protein